MAGLAVSASPAHAALECGDTITTDRTLHRDLECELDGNGLRIDGDDVTLDLNGHTISNDPQDDGSGILVGQSDGVRVVGGKVRGFNIGVNVGESTDVTVKDVNIRRAKGSGLFAAFANHVRFLENTVRGPSANGVTTQDSTDHIKIAGNDLSGVGIAIDGDDHKVIGNEISSPVGDGIAVLGGGGTELERNGITDAQEGAGIALNPGAGEVRVDENTVGGAEFGGIVTSAGAGPATIVHNAVRGVNFNGFFVGPTAEVVLRDNLAKGSQGGDGIHVEDDDTLIEDNRVIENDQHGIESSSANGSGNVARRNGIHPQCMPASLC